METQRLNRLLRISAGSEGAKIQVHPPNSSALEPTCLQFSGKGVAPGPAPGPLQVPSDGICSSVAQSKVGQALMGSWGSACHRGPLSVSSEISGTLSSKPILGPQCSLHLPP